MDIIKFLTEVYEKENILSIDSKRLLIDFAKKYKNYSVGDTSSRDYIFTEASKNR